MNDGTRRMHSTNSRNPICAAINTVILIRVHFGYSITDWISSMHNYCVHWEWRWCSRKKLVLICYTTQWRRWCTYETYNIYQIENWQFFLTYCGRTQAHNAHTHTRMHHMSWYAGTNTGDITVCVCVCCMRYAKVVPKWTAVSFNWRCMFMKIVCI